MGSCQITKNLRNLDLIDIIQFSLKIYDLWRHPLPMGGYGCMCGFIGGVMSKSLKIE